MNEYPFPVNVYLHCTGDKKKAERMEATPALEAAYEYIAQLALNERERTSLRMYYAEGKSYDEVGGCISVSKERARQIVIRALRKLRDRPEYVAIMEGNLFEYIEQQGKERYRKGFDKGFEAGIARTKLASDLKDKQDLDISAVGDITLGELFREGKLSARPFNCLSEAGYKTLKDVATTPALKLFGEPRNFGKHSAIEVTRILESHGYDVSEHQKILDGNYTSVHQRWLAVKDASPRETEETAKAKSSIDTFKERYKKGDIIFSNVLQRAFGNKAPEISQRLVNSKFAIQDKMIRCPQCDFATSRQLLCEQQELDGETELVCNACDCAFRFSDGLLEPVLVVL